MYAEVTRPVSGVVPIGRPVRGTRLYIQNQHSQIVPPGLPGELYIGGVGLARGYLGSPGLTAAAFVPDPFAEVAGSEAGARLYKTGDRARYLPDGRLVFLGRIDRQVKLDGFRIEPGEIEAILAQRPEVGNAAVLLREDQPGRPRFVAYVCPAQNPAGQALVVENLRETLKTSCPTTWFPPYHSPRCR